MTTKLFGWIPPSRRTRKQWQAHEQAMLVALAPPNDVDFPRDDSFCAAEVGGAAGDLTTESTASADDQGVITVRTVIRPAGPNPPPPPPPPPPPNVDRFALWQLAEKAYGGRLPYIWQVTGSCVGAGGNNCIKTLQGVEIALGDKERWVTIFWLFSYGQSRLRLGDSGEGEGSTGGAFAAAAREDGNLGVVDAADLPQLQTVQGWLKTDQRTEYHWSAGGWSKRQYGNLAIQHLVGQVRPVTSVADAIREIRSGNPLTCASNFGTRTIRPQGSPAVNIAMWNDTWPHQMYLDEHWKHPTLGDIFRMGNNWGPDAHPAPTQGEPAGGFYLLGSTFDQIIRSRDSEVYAFQGLNGWARAARVGRLMAEVQRGGRLSI